MRTDLPTGTVTFLFTDIEGSTRLLHELGAERYADALAEHRRLVREAFAAEGGVEFGTEGDALFYVFAEAAAAAAAAAAANEALSEGRIRIRMGLHTGKPHLTDEGYVGEDVHLGARIAAAGHGGQVLLSAATRAFVDAQVTELGEHRLKDFAEPVTIFQLGVERFSPLKTVSNTNLPRPSSSFVGRERETTEVAELVREHRLVTLSGPGGSGKTRLSIEVSAGLVGEFKGGVFWVPLAPLRDAALVLDTIGQILGASETPADHIGEREMLLVLDNFEQVAAAAPELASLVESCPNLHLLVTTRERMRVRGEAEYPVPPLAGPEAVALFCERASLEEDETIAELCRRLDNLPLAVEFASARVGILSPSQILGRLGQRLDLLKGGRDATDHQQTLRATIEWSHDLLADDEKRLFARLAVFNGGCTVDAAEQVCDAGLDTLESLVDKSLVRHTLGRFWMLETIRDYAVERLDASGEAEELRRRRADHFLALAEEAHPHTGEFSSEREWLDRLGADHDNFRDVLSWLEDGARTQEALQLAGALADFWSARGFVAEGYRRLERALARDTAPTAARARALNAAADLGGLSRVDPETAVYWAEQGLQLSRELGDRAGSLAALHCIAHAACDRGDFASARGLIEEGLSLAEELRDPIRVASMTWMLGWACSGLGDVARARELYEDALKQARAGGLPTLEAIVLYTLSGRLLADGEPDRALELIQEVWELACAHGDRSRMSSTAWRLGSILAALDRPVDAALAHAAGTRSFEEMNGTVHPPAAEHVRTLERLRQDLGEDGLELQLRRAEKLSLEEAVDAALGTA